MSAASEAVSGNKVRPLGVLTWGAGTGQHLASACSEEHKVRVPGTLVHVSVSGLITGGSAELQ